MRHLFGGIAMILFLFVGTFAASVVPNQAEAQYVCQPGYPDGICVPPIDFCYGLKVAPPSEIAAVEKPCYPFPCNDKVAPPSSEIANIQYPIFDPCGPYFPFKLTIDAGPDQTVSSGSTVQLMGTVTVDQGIATIATVQTVVEQELELFASNWEQVSGPEVTLSDKSILNPTFQAPVLEPGAADVVIVFELSAKPLLQQVPFPVWPQGEIGLSAEPVEPINLDNIQVQITVQAPPLPEPQPEPEPTPENGAPIANAGADQEVLSTATVSLDGSASSDPDGDTLTFAWEQTAGTTVSLDDATATAPSFTPPEGGVGTPDEVLTFTLTVSDGEATSTDTVTITVQYPQVQSTGDSLDAVATSPEQIEQFVETRASTLMALPTNRQRRFDRLTGSAGNGGAVTRALTYEGITLMRLPADVQIGEDTLAFAASASDFADSSNIVDFWLEGRFARFDVEGLEGKLGALTFGVDRLVTPDLLVGGFLQLDRVTPDDFSEPGAAQGWGYLVGPYATARLDDNLFADARLAFGGSTNDITPDGVRKETFETSRLMFDGAIVGVYELSNGLTFTPGLSIKYMRETQEAFTDSLSVDIAEMEVETGEISFNPRLSREVTLSNGWDAVPYVEVAVTRNYLSSAGSVLEDATRGRVQLGASVVTHDGARFRFGAYQDGIGIDDYDIKGLDLSMQFKF